MPTATPALTSLARRCSSFAAAVVAAQLWLLTFSMALPRAWKRIADDPAHQSGFPSSRAIRRLPPIPGRTRRCRHRREPARPRSSPAACCACCWRARARNDPVPDLHQGGRGGDGEPHRRPARGLGADEGTRPREGSVRAWRAPRPDALKRARQLFARVLEAPGGLRIQTIHSFAQTLLAAFPAEAGIAPGFQPIEGRAEQELVRSTLADLLADAEAAATAGCSTTCGGSACGSARAARSII